MSSERHTSTPAAGQPHCGPSDPNTRTHTARRDQRTREGHHQLDGAIDAGATARPQDDCGADGRRHTTSPPPVGAATVSATDPDGTDTDGTVDTEAVCRRCKRPRLRPARPHRLGLCGSLLLAAIRPLCRLLLRRLPLQYRLMRGDPILHLVARSPIGAVRVGLLIAGDVLLPARGYLPPDHATDWRDLRLSLHHIGHLVTEERAHRMRLEAVADYQAYLHNAARHATIAAVRAGFHTGPVPYGYRARSVPVLLANGRTVHRRRLVPAPGTAKIVNRIFAWTAAGHEPSQTAARLRRLECPAPGNTGWSSTTVRAILSNLKYTGRQVWSRHIAGRPAHPADWVVSAPNAHAPLVSDEVFIAANPPTANAVLALRLANTRRSTRAGTAA